MAPERADELIVVDPGMMCGKPVVRGTRITVEYILEQVRFGRSFDELLAGHPRLTREGIEAAWSTRWRPSEPSGCC
ncbi:MAG: DUF433 domain-containing protein [Pseudomonadota bacterium]